MKTTHHLILTALLAALVHCTAQVNILPGGTYTENFDTLGSSSGSRTDDWTLPGWYAAITPTV